MLNISSKTKSHILVLIFGPHVPLWLPSIVTLHVCIVQYLIHYMWCNQAIWVWSRAYNISVFYIIFYQTFLMLQLAENLQKLVN